MADIITTTGAKGGAGKTACAIHLAAEAHRRGLRVLLADADPRGVSLTWQRTGRHRGLSVPDAIGVGEELIRVIPERAPFYDLIIIDTEGRVGKRLSRALDVCGVALLPVKPEPSDLWVLAESIAVVQAKIDKRPRMRAYLALCCAERTRLTKAAAQAVAQAQLPSLATVLKRSTNYGLAQNEGRGITAAFPRTEHASQLSALLDELLEAAQQVGHAA